MFLVGHLVFEAICDLDVKGVGGLTFGADPIAVATAFASELKGNPIHAFSIRKTQKNHGLVKWVEGDLIPGDKVVIIDDVATTGGSTIKAIEPGPIRGFRRGSGGNSGRSSGGRARQYPSTRPRHSSHYLPR